MSYDHYSMVSAIPVSRIKHLLNLDSVIHADYAWDTANADRPWDYALDVTGALATQEMLELTCPLSFNKEGVYAIADLSWIRHLEVSGI